MVDAVILGAGGLAREGLDVFNALNASSNTHYNVLGFIDENPKNWGKILNGCPVLGGFEWFEKPRLSEIKVVCQVGSPPIKLRLVRKAQELKLGFCTIVHPTAVITPFVDVGDGTVITAGCILTNNIVIGSHVLLNLDCTVGHDSVIEDFCTVSPGVHISGNVRLRRGCEIGTGVAIIPDVEIGEWSIVAVGAVVTHDVPPNTTVAGVPARVIKGRHAGWQQEIAARGLL